MNSLPVSSRQFVLWICLLVATGCIEPFEPKIAASDSGYLVVDGAINSHGKSLIKLSHAVNLNQQTTAPVESKAKVYIEQKNGGRYPLVEGPLGTYQSAALAISAGQLVRLHFTTVGGKEYASEYTPVNATPEIDSVSWRTEAQGLQLYVNTHDQVSERPYYRWSYDETWEFTSMVPSLLEFEPAADKNMPGKMIFRVKDIYHCWASENSTAIKLGTTVKLGQNVISQQPLTLLPSNSVKLRYKYSILVRQYALSAEEYSYWEALRKNTENIGTLFDPLPTQLTGNVHNVADASEPVIGFVGAQSVSEKRIFIRREQLPNNWNMLSGYEMCSPDTVPHLGDLHPTGDRELLTFFFSTGIPIPIKTFKLRPRSDTTYYVYSTSDCLDCRKRGTDTRPSFWQ
ncbi:DUF4249 domain-containing protein [Hymenobacter fodinae]|uniref:DUF4249 domain-containing protein n=1 Tax=Hymenobacter fodinae TaxID=2510796 RepID=A0A4Z0PC66_9BACT|nr:DUF4249 domain-containing protein [Hymenobacter fodinae]TGE10246.1 DUF4249 domain-containing protein [Hymenobacter fodinae]